MKMNGGKRKSFRWEVGDISFDFSVRTTFSSPVLTK
jgi:hypothetical protein